VDRSEPNSIKRRRRCGLPTVKIERQSKVAGSASRVAQPGTRDPQLVTPLAAARRAGRGGYLLFEVLLALAILTIVVVLVFRIIQTTVRATLDISYLQTKEEQAQGLVELLRQNFVTVPQVASFQTRVRDGATELIFQKTPFTFSWSKQGPQFGTVVLAARPQANGKLSFSIIQEPEDATERYVGGTPGKKPNWFVVLPDLSEATWRFYNESAGKWETAWTNPATKPALIEFTFKLSGDPRVQRGIFRWPVANSAAT
jgi:hypothetical protein